MRSTILVTLGALAVTSETARKLLDDVTLEFAKQVSGDGSGLWKKCSCGVSGVKNPRSQFIGGDPMSGYYAECVGCGSTKFVPEKNGG